MGKLKEYIKNKKEEKANKPPKEIKKPKIWQALLVLGILVASIAVGILIFDADAHVPMLVGVAATAIMALFLGCKWEQIEKFMIDGIQKSLQSILILILIGVLVGVWIVAGIVPTMIYYGLAILKPQIFFLAALIICSISSLATGSSWGTMGTMGVALLGIGAGLNMPIGITAGAIISGAYFGDKLSPLSDTTNLAPSMAGTDVMTHIKHMLPSTLITYVICAIFFTIMGFIEYKGGSADVSKVQLYMDTIKDTFTISPLLFIPPIVVIVVIALKMPAIPGIAIGIFAGAIFGMLFGNCSLGDVFICGMDGYAANTGIAEINDLLSNGGIMNMTFAISLIVVAMMFGGIMEGTGLLGVLVNKIKRLAKGPTGLVAITEVTCITSNIIVPDQYISIIIPGRMYADEYREMELSPSSLSNALESAGTVTSALVPWNTCGAYITSNLGVTVAQYGVWAVFNWMMPVVTIILSIFGLNIKDKDGVLLFKKRRMQKKEKKMKNDNVIIEK